MKTLTPIKLVLILSFIFSASLHGLSNGIGIVDGAEGEYLTLVESHVSVEVNNQISTTIATQKFRNDFDFITDFKYAFPLNEGANPTQLRWFINGEWTSASVSSNPEDEDIPGTGGGSSSIDYYLENYLGNHPFFFSAMDSLATDSLIIFELTYVELLTYDYGIVNYFMKNDLSGIQDLPVDYQTFNFTLYSGREILEVDLAGINTDDDISEYEANLNHQLTNEDADFDFLIEYQLSSDGLGLIPLSVYLPDTLFNCDDAGNGYATFIIEPEFNSEIVIDKNFTLVIDKSGSMGGVKIVQAKEAATFIVNNLNSGDYFNIVDFSTDVFSLFGEHVEYNSTNKNLALDYISTISEGGYTNISSALSNAINEFDAVEPDKANIIIFFTDGQASEGILDTPGILNQVQNDVASIGTSIFLFSFGIGESVDEGLLTSLSQQNNGIPNFVGSNDLEEEITSFFLTINNPVLINTQVSFDPPILSEIFPNPFPNLYKGQQLILSGRYDSAQAITMHMEGQTFNLPVSYDFEINLADTNNVDLSMLPKIWAKQKIDALTLDYYLADTFEQQIIQDEIDSVSICYEVISTEFTSFEDPDSVEIEEELEVADANQILVSPNPFQDEFTLDLSAVIQSVDDARIEIYSLTGQKVYERLIANNFNWTNLKIKDLLELDPGLYLMQITIGTKVYTIKIVKR